MHHKLKALDEATEKFCFLAVVGLKVRNQRWQTCTKGKKMRFMKLKKEFINGSRTVLRTLYVNLLNTVDYEMQYFTLSENLPFGSRTKYQGVIRTAISGKHKNQ